MQMSPCFPALMVRWDYLLPMISHLTELDPNCTYWTCLNNFNSLIHFRTFLLSFSSLLLLHFQFTCLLNGSVAQSRMIFFFFFLIPAASFTNNIGKGNISFCHQVRQRKAGDLSSWDNGEVCWCSRQLQCTSFCISWC